MLNLYFAVTLAALAALAAMIGVIARTLADCPENSRRAKAAGVSIATGYLSIGGGTVLLFATLPALAPDAGMLIFAMGMAVIVLGLGFTQAVRTLRAVVDHPPAPARTAAPWVVGDIAETLMEPVLGKA